jgi:hypothetical protein
MKCKKWILCEHHSHNGGCPLKTDSNCNIIKKEKDVKIKVWGRVSEGKIRGIADYKSTHHNIPCVISFDRNYLKNRS